MKNYLLTAFVCLLITFNTFSQNTGEDELGSWYELTSSNRISDKISISASVTNWNYELASNHHLLLGIIGLNYHIKKNITARIGYGNANIDTSFEYNDNLIHTN